MPAFFLLLRIKKFIVPLPWFFFWLLLFPLVPLAMIVSPFFGHRECRSIMKNAHLVWWVLVALHGLKVDVNSKSGDRVFLSFV
jgi:hypothetical protein